MTAALEASSFALEPPATIPGQPLESITTHETPIRHFIAGKMPPLEAMKSALADALEYKGNMPASVLAMQGMSGKKYRYFINNLVARMPNPRYLEVGSWAGSTLCSAINGNDVTATAIDNWSQFGGPANLFFQNLSQAISPQARVNVINSDFRQVDFAALGKFNIYLFDGPHEYEDQRDGLLMALDCLDNEFVFIVDDWNWAHVRNATMVTIAQANLTVMWSTEIRTTDDDSLPQILYQESDWHNGYYIALLRK